MVLHALRTSFTTLRHFVAPAWPPVSSQTITLQHVARLYAAQVEAAHGNEDIVTLTDSAVQKLQQLAQQEQQPVLLRLTVEGGGCSGFSYEFKLDSKLEKNDKVFEQGGVKLVIDSLSLDFVKGSTVDYTSDLMRAAFTVLTNPNAASSCGCGSSFAPQ